MRSLRLLAAATLLLSQAACDQDPTTTRTPAEPPASAQGVQAFVQVDNDHAKPGDVIHVFVKVQLGTESQAKVGSYTGRLRFDPAALVFRSENKINDGLRVSNPTGATGGDIRFAGASATGFTNLTLFDGAFEVKRTDYQQQLALELPELSSALTLTNLQPQLNVTPQIFLRVSGR
jgi:hypothetical protein